MVLKNHVNNANTGNKQKVKYLTSLQRSESQVHRSGLENVRANRQNGSQPLVSSGAGWGSCFNHTKMILYRDSGLHSAIFHFHKEFTECLKILPMEAQVRTRRPRARGRDAGPPASTCALQTPTCTLSNNQMKKRSGRTKAC